MKKDFKIARAERDAAMRAKAASIAPMAGEPPVATWSARMPAYCYTDLCPVPELRKDTPVIWSQYDQRWVLAGQAVDSESDGER